MNPSTPGGSSPDTRDLYLARIRDRLELYTAEEVGKIVGVPIDKVYTLNIPGFNPGERRNRWDGYTLADFLERKKTSNGVFTYVGRIANLHEHLSATRIGQLLGMHSDAVEFLGLADRDIGNGRMRYDPRSLADWLDKRKSVPDLPMADLPPRNG